MIICKNIKSKVSIKYLYGRQANDNVYQLIIPYRIKVSGAQLKETIHSRSIEWRQATKTLYQHHARIH